MGQAQNISLLTAYAQVLYRWHIMHSHDAKEREKQRAKVLFKV